MNKKINKKSFENLFFGSSIDLVIEYKQSLYRYLADDWEACWGGNFILNTLIQMKIALHAALFW